VIEADLVVHNIGQLVTCEPMQGEGALGLLESAAVAARDGHIVWVGPSGRWHWRLELTADARVIDAEGRCCLPGFVDARANLVWHGSRADEHAARLRGQPFWGGGIMRSVRLTRSAGTEELARAAEWRLRSFLRHGITTVESRTGFGLTPGDEERLLEVSARVAARTPVKVVPTLMAAHVVPDGAEGDAYLEEVVEEMLPRLRHLAAFAEAWCDPGAFKAEQCRRLLRKALGAGYQLKLQASQVAPGEGPRVAVELGATTVEELNYLRDGDARMLAESTAVCVICPGSTLNLRLASEGAARTLAAAGCQLAIATDFNPGTSCSENMCLMIGLACLELGLAPEEAVRAATLGGARALRQQRHAGSVRMGKRCDLLLLDADSYLEIPYRLGVNLVATTICQGRVFEAEPGGERPVETEPVGARAEPQQLELQHQLEV
jgi:imidazolonepropionase